MKRLDLIPYPLSVEYLGGERKITEQDISSVSVRRDSSLGEEEYILEIAPGGISGVCSCDRGEFYIVKTLEQLAGTCPCVRIKDKPRFPFRSFMLDPVRHLVSIEDTKRFIDAAASVKMNVMHWHLTDDQGWRIQLENYPEMTEKASMRPGNHYGKRNHSDEEYGGYFTGDEIREIIDYAAERFITVIPEFELPGHSRAAIHAHPELSCTGKLLPVETRQGIFPDMLCPGKKQTTDFICGILDEMCSMFPGEYIHIGGDEAPAKRHLECPDCLARMKNENLKDNDELQGAFTRDIVDFLASKGKKAIVWNESLRSGLVKGVTVQSWMDKQGLCAEYANSGGKVIYSDFFHLYCDYPYGMTPLKKTYNSPVLFKGLTDEGKKNIIGVESPLWTEFIDNSERLFFLAFPRFTAAAEIGWTDENNLDESDFERRFRIYSAYLRSIGIEPAPPKRWNPLPLRKLADTLPFFTNMSPKASKGWE